MPNNNPNNKFVFTLHNWTPTDWDHLRSFCENEDNKVKYLKVAKETGKEGESPHLQGCAFFNSRTFKKQRPSAISKLLMGPNEDVHLPDPRDPGKFLKKHYHVDGMRGTLAEASECCGNIIKEGECETYVCGEIPASEQGRRTDHEAAQECIIEQAKAGVKFSVIEDALPSFADKSNAWMRKKYMQHRIFEENFFEINKPFEWQGELADYLSRPPDERKIVFVVDPEGNAGKTEFMKNASFLIPDKDVFTCSPKDVKTLSSLIPDDGADVILIDCPRSIQCDLACDFIEEVKNGFVINEKCQCAVKRFKVPHVVIFMNRYPKFGKTVLSADRCVIIEPELTAEEKEKLDTQQTIARDPHLEKHMKRTREIMEEAETHKEMKREEKRARDPF